MLEGLGEPGWWYVAARLGGGRTHAASIVFVASLAILTGSLKMFYVEPAHAQASDDAARVNEMLRETVRLGRAGRATEAEALARETLTAAENAFGHSDVATADSFHNLGDALYALDRLEDALEHHRRALSIYEQLLPEKDPRIAVGLTSVAFVLKALSRYGEAEQLFRRVLAIREKALPGNHPDIATSLGNLAATIVKLNKYDEAEILYRRAMEIRDKVLPEDHEDIALGLSNLGVLLMDLNQLDEAENLFRRALAIFEKTRSEDHRDIVRTLSNLGVLLNRLNRPAEAEELHRRALAMREKTLPENHLDIADALHNLASALEKLNRYDEAEKLGRRALAIRERVLPGDHEDIALSLNNLAFTVSRLGRFEEAVALARRALAIREQIYPENHPSIATTLNNLGMMLQDLNQYEEAERLVRRALAIREQSLPQDHADIATSLSNLAQLLKEWNRPEEVEPLLLRALAMRQRVLPASHPLIGQNYNSLATVMQSLNRLEEAEQYYRKALTIFEQSLPPDDPEIATTLSNLGVLLGWLNRFDEAEPFHRRALFMLEKTLPENHTEIAQSLNNLASLLFRAGRFAEADPYQRRALAILEQALPPNHPTLASGLENGAWITFNEGLFEEALSFLDRATRIRAARENVGATLPDRWLFQAFLRIRAADALSERDDNAAVDTVLEAYAAAFLDLQRASSAGAGSAIASAAMRARAADPEVAELMRRRDQTLRDVRRIDSAFLTVSSADLDRDARALRLTDLRTRSDALRDQLTGIDDEIARRFPQYTELRESPPLSFGELQPLLAPDEVLVLVVPHGEAGLVFAISRDDGVFTYSPEIRDAASLAVRLRCSAAARLDPTCVGSTGADAAVEDSATRGAVSLANDVPVGAFDLATAYSLYNRLFRDVHGFIAGKKLIVVPAPELLGLPWHLLITEAPPAGWDAADADRAAIYRNAAWLFQSHPSITVLPAVSSLRALRDRAPQRQTADRSFLGVGDPVIGRTTAERNAEPVNCGRADSTLRVSAVFADGLVARSPADAAAQVFVGDRDEAGFALADPERVRVQARLADTRCEVEGISASLGGAGVDLLFGADASETQIKELDETGTLSRYRVLHFATHGLVGGELGVGEPGLVLTPPATATPRDDGVLTASEIATLTLAADWVVLSACNTAAGSEGDAEALSGLAKSFFYAGARSLLVSSWPVYSPAAVDITTHVFAAMKANPGMGRSEALTIAMRATLAASTNEHTAHPAYWAPFFLVGEGGL